MGDFEEPLGDVAAISNGSDNLPSNYRVDGRRFETWKNRRA